MQPPTVHVWTGVFGAANCTVCKWILTLRDLKDSITCMNEYISLSPRPPHSPVFFDHLQHAKMDGEGLVQIYHVNGINVYLGRQRGRVLTKRTYFAQTIFVLKNEWQGFSFRTQAPGQKLQDKASNSFFQFETLPSPLCTNL